MKRNAKQKQTQTDKIEINGYPKQASNQTVERFVYRLTNQPNAHNRTFHSKPQKNNVDATIGDRTDPATHTHIKCARVLLRQLAVAINGCAHLSLHIMTAHVLVVRIPVCWLNSVQMFWIMLQQHKYVPTATVLGITTKRIHARATKERERHRQSEWQT